MKPITKTQTIKTDDIIGTRYGLLGENINFTELYNTIVELCKALDNENFRQELIEYNNYDTSEHSEIIKKFPFHNLNEFSKFDYMMNDFIIHGRNLEYNSREYISKHFDISDEIKSEDEEFMLCYDNLTNFSEYNKPSFIKTFPFYCMDANTFGFFYDKEIKSFIKHLDKSTLTSQFALKIDLESFTIKGVYHSRTGMSYDIPNADNVKPIDVNCITFPFTFHVVDESPLGDNVPALYVDKDHLHELMGKRLTEYGSKLSIPHINKYTALLNKFAPNQMEVKTIDDLVEVYLEFYKMFLFRFFLHSTYKPFSRVY